MDHLSPRPQTRHPRPISNTEPPVDNQAPVRKSSYPRFLGPTLIVLLILIALYIVSSLTSLNPLGLNKNQDAWKAVFLTNDQVYFGHITSESSDPLVLRDIYYLQAVQPLQQVDQGQTQTSLSQNQLPLIKLGKELHGPEDEMRINKEHVLFVETLRADARVTEAIEAYMASDK